MLCPFEHNLIIVKWVADREDCKLGGKGVELQWNCSPKSVSLCLLLHRQVKLFENSSLRAERVPEKPVVRVCVLTAVQILWLSYSAVCLLVTCRALYVPSCPPAF